ncbi:MAG TPA: autotransporter-associated beta strand repeat-containing protein [Tepidisphaeraceae bacterium]|jgi:autotransporter-associated beta strand protein
MNGTFLSRRALRALAGAAVLSLSATGYSQVSGSWITLGGGSWSVGSNWTSNPLFPDGGGTATVSVGDASIRLDTNVTLGRIAFQPGRGSSILGTSSITLVGPGQINTAFALPGPQMIIAQAGASITSIIAGSAGLTKTGPGLLSLGGINSFSGGVSVNGGTLIASSDAALGATGGSIILNGGVLAAGNSSGSITLRNFQVTAAGGGIFKGPSGNDLLLFGSLSGTGTFSKLSDGTLILLADNPLSGPFRLGSGNGTVRLASNAGALRSVPLFSLGGTLTLANTSTLSFNTDRLGDAANLVLNGGALQMLSGDLPVLERVGTVTLGRGVNYLTIGTTEGLSGSELDRQNRSILVLSGTGPKFDTPPTLVGGGGSIANPDTSIVPWAFSAGIAPANLVTFDASGLRPLTTYLSSIPSGTITTSNVKLGAASFTLSAPSTINSLVISSLGTSLLGSPTLTISSGVILSGSGTNTIATPIDFSSAEGLIHVAAGSLTISGAISGNNGLTISRANRLGGGVVFLSAANTYTGTTTLNDGTVAITANVLPNTPGPFGNDSSPIVLTETAAISASATTFARDLIVRSDLDTSTARFPGISGGIFSGNVLLDGILGISGSTVTSVIGGSGTLRVTNSATLSGNNTFTGGIWNNGNLIVGSDTALGTGTTVCSSIGTTGFFNASTLTATGGSRSLTNPFAIGNLTISGAFATTLAGPVHLNGGITTLSVANNTPTALITGPISDGQLLFNGGRIVLAGNNSQYATTINSGTVTVLSSFGLGGGSGASPPLLTSVGTLGTLELFAGVVIPPHRLEVASGTIGLVGLVGNSTWSGDVARTANTLRIAVNADTLTIGGTLDTNDGTFEKLGGGTLSLGNLRSTATVTISGGAIRIRPDGTDNGVSNVPTLLIAGGVTPTARLDLTNNNLVVDYTGPSPAATIRAQIRSAAAGTAWNGNGIGTSMGNNARALGIAEASDLFSTFPATFSGQTVDSTSVLIEFTTFGDADLDGDVDGSDIGTWAENFTGELSGAGTKLWSQGDWDYDGDVDGVDASRWARWFTGELGGGLGDAVIDDASIAPGATAILRGMGIIVLPEPASVIGLALGIVAAKYRRRRRC